MLIPIMDISRLIVHGEEIEEQNLKQVGRELNRTREGDVNSSKARFKVQDNPKKRLPNQGPPNTQGSTKVKCLHPSLKRGKVVVLMLRSQLVKIVVENMKASA